MLLDSSSALPEQVFDSFRETFTAGWRSQRAIVGYTPNYKESITTLLLCVNRAHNGVDVSIAQNIVEFLLHLEVCMEVWSMLAVAAAI